MTYGIEIRNDGTVLIYAGDVAAAVRLASQFKRFVSEQEGTVVPAALKKELSIGAVDPAMDGWIYAGLSPEDGKAFWAAPQDEPDQMGWKEAKARAVTIQDQFKSAGKPDRVWVPTNRELDHLYRHKDQGALRGTFNETGSFPAGYYWSSSESSFSNARGQRFSDGFQDGVNKSHGLSVRCVRRLGI